MPVADEIRPFTSSAYLLFHALDELRQQYGMRLGQIVPVSQREIAEVAGLSQGHIGELTNDLEKDGWLTHEPHRGYIQHRHVPVMKVRQ